MSPRVAMVLAAGLGTRMGALTRDCPKPLLRVAGRTLLDRALDRAAEAGAQRAVVNVHYLAPRIRAHLAGRAALPEVAISDEAAQLLDTGGGLRHARALLGEGPVWALNSDAVWTGATPLAGLAAAWDGARMDALLQLIPRARARAHSRPGDFFLRPDGRPERRGAADAAPYVYSGAQIVRTEAAEGPEGPFSANLIWDRAAAAGRLFAVVHDGDWVDVGTPEGLAAAEAALTGAEGP